MADPAEFSIVGATFESNRGTSGGAVFFASIIGTTGGFEFCLFDGNDGTNGGALYVETVDAGDSRKTNFVRDSVFLNNSAGERKNRVLYFGQFSWVDSWVLLHDICILPIYDNESCRPYPALNSNKNYTG